jgi:hypothetical protein
MNYVAWARLALDLAEKTAPKTSWRAEPIPDFYLQRLSLSTMQAQLLDQALHAREKAMSAPAQWATTGRWPRLRNAAAFFLREAIRSARERSALVPCQDSSREYFYGPPWSADEATWLSAMTVEEWYARQLRPWAMEQAQGVFEFQERFLDSLEEPYG